MRPQTMRLEGLERQLIFNRLRAVIGERWELPGLIEGLALPEGSRCLEIGTGTGWGTLGVARHIRPALMVATDYDADILPMTRHYFDQQRVGERVVMAQADAKQLPFRDHTFDLVLGLYVLHHVMGYREALAEIKRVTRPGGWFVWIDPIRPASSSALVKRIWPSWLATEKELALMLEEAGFYVERWSRILSFSRVVARTAA
ncbi:MAG TPA: methyltransferase domain-containing protein [Herpetosiphonaceae bacterium]